MFYLTPNDFALLAQKAARLHFYAGEVLIHEGTAPKQVFFLQEGAVLVSHNGAVVASLKAGEVCGEMAFLEQRTASATVTAKELVTALAISVRDLQDIFETFPHLGSRFYRSLAITLSKRLRSTTDLVQSHELATA
jgi:CRP-like cAMP-binding protein